MFSPPDSVPGEPVEGLQRRDSAAAGEGAEPRRPHGRGFWVHPGAQAQGQGQLFTRARTDTHSHTYRTHPLMPSLLQMMKIYDKLCELKGCNTLTGRVIEQRISYSGTRHPEINKRVKTHTVSSGIKHVRPFVRFQIFPRRSHHKSRWTNHYSL